MTSTPNNLKHLYCPMPPRERSNRQRAPAPRISGVRLWGKFKKARYWSYAYWLLVNEIYRRHPGEFFERIRNLRGSKYPWFAYQEEACSTQSPEKWVCISCRSFGQRSFTYHACLLCHQFFPEDARAIYVHVDGTTVALKRKSEKLLETFGYSSNDPGIWEIVTE